MATIASNAFEIERRLISLKYNTNMPDNTILGYDGDPNLVVNNSNPGQTLIYNVALGATFLQSTGQLWYKQELPCKWVLIGGSTTTLNSTVVTKTIAFGDTEVFYTLALSKNKNFEFMVESTLGTSKSYAKFSALYTGTDIVSTEYSFLGTDLDMEVVIEKVGTDCVLSITNNEATDLTCSVKVESLNEL